MSLFAILLPLFLCATVDGGSLTYPSRQAGSLPWAAKKPAEPVDQSRASGYVVCPDHASQCQAGSTCCQAATGQWACCPYVEAVCCSDHLHCCPDSYTCDLDEKTCVKTISLPATRRPGTEPTTAALTYGPLTARTLCPGGGQCPQHSSCCRTYHNTYQCCDYPKNVCCDDGVHCCFSGTICQQPTLTCITVDKSSPSMALETLTGAAIKP